VTTGRVLNYNYSRTHFDFFECNCLQNRTGSSALLPFPFRFSLSLWSPLSRGWKSPDNTLALSLCEKRKFLRAILEQCTK